MSPGLFAQGGEHLFKLPSASLGIRFFGDRNQPSRRMSVAGQDHLLAGLGAANELGQMALGVGDGNTHVRFLLGSPPVNMDQTMVHFKSVAGSIDPRRPC